jgi:low temperature requirement protein LtrA
VVVGTRNTDVAGRMLQYRYETGTVGGSLMTSSRQVPLRRGEGPPHPTFLELFFDLALVFALFQVSRTMLEHLNWTGGFQVLVLFVAVWRIWFLTTWITNRLDQGWWPVQLMVILTLTGGLILAVAVPAAFGRNGLIFAGVNVGIRVGQHLFVAFILRGHEMQRIAVGALVWTGVSAPAWIAGGLTHGVVRGVLWALAVAIDYFALSINFRIPGQRRTATTEAPVAAEHLAERYRQIFIIALGELIIASALTLSGQGFARARTAAFLETIATTVLLWRIYIHRSGQLLSAAFAKRPISPGMARWAGHTHLVMVAGLVITAVGDELVIAHPSARTPLTWAVVILGGPALFLVARAGTEYLVFARVSANRMIGVLVLAALTPVALHLVALMTATAAALLLAGIAITDARRGRRRPEEPPAPPAPGPS